MNGLQFHLDLIYFGNDIVPSAFPEQLVQKKFLPRRPDEKWDIFHFNRKLGLAINCSGQIVDMDGMELICESPPQVTQFLSANLFPKSKARRSKSQIK